MKFFLGAALAVCSLLQASGLSKQLAVLDHSRDPARIEAAAVAIVASGDAKAIAQLAQHLGERSFLHRLDPGRGAESDTRRLSQVFGALAEHPTSATDSLCISLARNAAFTSLPARLNFLLNALAAVRPLSEGAAGIFRETSRSGYLEVNGPLLARNASPRALQVLEALFADESLDAVQRLSMAHWSLLPVRTDPDLIAMCSRLALSGRLSPEVRVGIVETLFDYQPRRWFGVAGNQPTPPVWTSAPERAKEMLRSLGKTLLNRSDLTSGLRTAIQTTLDELR